MQDDPFTGAKTVSFDFKNKSVYFTLANDSARLEIKFNYLGEFNTAVSKGAEIMLKFDTGDILKLATDKAAYPVTSVSGTTIISQYTYSMPLRKEVLTQLSSGTLSMMRHPDGKGGFTDIEFKGGAKKWGKSLANGAQCLLSNL